MASEVLPQSLQRYKPSPNEHEAVKHLFKHADTDSLGVLTGDKAVPFFSHSSLPPALLGQIWQEADPENSGFLTQERFGVACRLIGHAQATGASAEINPEWVETAGPLPKFEGFPIPAHLVPSGGSSSPAPPSTPPPATASPRAAAPLPIQSQSTGSSAGVSITPEERARYSKLFNGSGPVAGLLDGDKARDIFIKSQLPFETLGKIWSLADTHSRGSLDVADFTIGMHLIQHTMNGTLSTLPSVLQPALYASAAALPLNSPGAPATPRAVPGSPLRRSSIPVQQQYTGQGFTGRSTFAPPPVQQQPALAWEITPQEKSDSDGYFDGIDAERKGFIEGEAAVQFFSQSGLPIEVLARVWDLADIRQSGALNKDEFAVALRLLRDKLAGKELPASLPLTLVPPSLRAPPGVAPPQGPLMDLFDLDADDEPAVASLSLPQLAPTVSSVFATPPGPSTIFPQGTGGSARGISPQVTGYGATSLQGTIFPQATGVSATSKTLSPQSTGFGGNFTPAASTSRAVVAPTATSSTFFDDNDDADQSAKLSADSAQLGQLKTEHDSVSNSVEKLTLSRGELESSIATTTSAINDLHAKLASARTAHESERALVDDLQTRQKDQAALLARARTELITAESDLSALRVERTEIEGNFLRDKEEVREMKKKMAEVTKETTELKEILEKLKKEARQTKGLVAIGKKQLTTTEAEKEKVAKEIESEKEASSSSSRAVVEPEESPFDHSLHAPAPAAASLPLPVSPAVTSPTSSIRSTNPFDRMGTFSTAVSPQPTGVTPAVTSSSHSIPIMAAAAVGAGAVAAASALGAGVAGVLGISEHEKKEPEDEVATSGPTIEDAKVEKPVAQTPAAETDPFGVPVSTTSAEQAAPASFDDAFGDDFASKTVAHESAAVPASFDDAFADMDEPSASTSATEPPASTMAHSAEATSVPAAEDSETTVEGHEAVSTPKAEDLAVAEPASHHLDEASPVSQQIEEPDSSDDEDVIEDATPTHHSAGTSRDLSETTSTPVATSTSDSGESFVHVPSANAVDSEAESKFPPLDSVDVPASSKKELGEGVGAAALGATALGAVGLAAAIPGGPLHGDRSVSPASELDTYEDAAATSSVFDDPPNSAGDKPVTSTRRAAPPPPTRTSLPVASPAAPTSSTAFDDAFGSSFDAAPIAGAAGHASTAGDDFDDAFSDLPPAASVAKDAASPSADSTFASDFDTFDADDDFSFKPTFDAPTSPVAPSSASAFDDSFTNFDSSFEPAHSAQSSISPTGNVTGLTDSPQHGFSFDDAFGTTSAPNLAASLGKPAALSPTIPTRGASAVEEPTAVPAAAPAPTPALDDDHAGVKQIVAMGFSRGQAINALEKYNYDVGRALNSMLG